MSKQVFYDDKRGKWVLRENFFNGEQEDIELGGPRNFVFDEEDALREAERKRPSAYRYEFDVVDNPDEDQWPPY